ncbi:MAG TPA: OmpA family protein [Polyangiaceae bacterium]|jgi:outer membrane protein OmpA-like peptidoglycan-associated protein|nr:OmpA family protein [Polyangiaceae bacterium]
MTKSFSSLAALCALGVGLGACGKAAAPQELMDARTAYAEAAKGPAADLAPAQLDTAKTSLDAAQKSFDDDGPTQKTKDLAYVAERRSEIAAAEGGREKAERNRAAADKDFKNTQIEGLEKTKEQLEAEKRAREAANQDVNKTKAELAAEKAARAEAEKRAAAAMASLQEIAKVKEESRGVVITLSGSVLFPTGKSDILPIAKEKLDQVAKALKDQGFKAIIVQGYTDSRGNAADNDTLSLKRAQSVRDYLVSQGIPSDKISAEGLGSSKPVAPNDTADGRAENRRVEIVVTPADK